MRSADTEQSPKKPVDRPVDKGLDCAGLSYLERLGILYMAEIRLTIVMELYTREMSVRQFYDTVGGTTYMSVRRHFAKLVEHGWLRWVRDAPTGKKGRPEALYRATEQVLIDTETWRTIPVSMRDGFTVMLLEEMGARLGESLQNRVADARPDRVSAFKTFEVDEGGWCKAHAAVERCFQTLRDLQIDAKIRLDQKPERSSLMIINLAAFEVPGSQSSSATALPRAEVSLRRPWPERIGKVFSDRLNFAIVHELNRAALTPAQLCETLQETSTQGILRRCQRLTKLGWAVNVGTETGGPLYGASAYRFRAASPNVSERTIIERIPPGLRKGKSWEVFQPFLTSSMAAVEAGTFNNRDDRHLSMSPILVDEIGWEQVGEALSLYEKTLRGLEDETRRRRGKKPNFERFRAAFLMDSYRAPFREPRQ